MFSFPLRSVQVEWWMRRHLNTYMHSFFHMEVFKKEISLNITYFLQVQWLHFRKLKCLMFSSVVIAVPDASTYAHYLFNAFDTRNNGSIKFEVWRKCGLMAQNENIYFSDITYRMSFLSFSQDFVMGLSTLLRGTVREKLEWTFHLYDINRDGLINKEVYHIYIGSNN